MFNQIILLDLSSEFNKHWIEPQRGTKSQTFTDIFFLIILLFLTFTYSIFYPAVCQEPKACFSSVNSKEICGILKKHKKTYFLSLSLYLIFKLWLKKAKQYKNTIMYVNCCTGKDVKDKSKRKQIYSASRKHSQCFIFSTFY